MNWYKTFQKISQSSYNWNIYGGWVAPDGTATSVMHHGDLFKNHTDMHDHYDAFKNGYMRVVNPNFVPRLGRYEVYIETPQTITSEQLVFAEKMLSMVNKMSRRDLQATNPPQVFVERFDVAFMRAMTVQEALTFLRSIVGRTVGRPSEFLQHVSSPSRDLSESSSSGGA